MSILGKIIGRWKLAANITLKETESKYEVANMEVIGMATALQELTPYIELAGMIVNSYDMEWKDPVLNELINKVKELEADNA